MHFIGFFDYSDLLYVAELLPQHEIEPFFTGYFIINEPAAQREWINNAPNLVSWSKGLLDGIEGFDVELARMSTDGLTLVARNG